MTAKIRLLTAAALLAGTGVANANAIDIYSHTINNTEDGSFEGVNPAGGDVQSIQTTYNNTDQSLAWTYTVAPGANGSQNDGFWLVISDGPDPKFDEDEYAILFGDLDTGRLSAYVYNGRNQSDSWNDPGVLLEDFGAGAISVEAGAPGSNEQVVSFEIDTTTINNYSNSSGWDGVSFAESVGIWFHPTTGTSVTYDSNGALTSFRPRRAGWYDGNSIAVRQVPEPGILYLGALGLFAFGLSRKLGGTRAKRSAA